jgi:hypothetical protein
VKISPYRVNQITARPFAVVLVCYRSVSGTKSGTGREHGMPIGHCPTPGTEGAEMRMIRLSISVGPDRPLIGKRVYGEWLSRFRGAERFGVKL